MQLRTRQYFGGKSVVETMQALKMEQFLDLVQKKLTCRRNNE